MHFHVPHVESFTPCKGGWVDWHGALSNTSRLLLVISPLANLSLAMASQSSMGAMAMATAMPMVSHGQGHGHGWGFEQRVSATLGHFTPGQFITGHGQPIIHGCYGHGHSHGWPYTHHINLRHDMVAAR